MIYTKKANFPYPILMNFTDDYLDPEFELDASIRDNTDQYTIDITWKVSSSFIKGLLNSGKADLILIIKSKDNQFHKLGHARKPQIQIPKKKLCINTRTVMQLMIQVNEDISFAQNQDLNSFYDDVKEEIFVVAGNALGFSNTVIFDGSQNKPFELFEKKIDKDIKSDVEIRLGTETILIVYKKEDYQFVGIQGSKEFNYPYIYMGLQKALISFLIQQTQKILRKEFRLMRWNHLKIHWSQSCIVLCRRKILQSLQWRIWTRWFIRYPIICL